MIRTTAHAVILDRQGRLIAVNPSYKAGWDLPGGMAEDGETPHAAATREIAEEIGIEVRLGRLLVRDVRADGQDDGEGDGEEASATAHFVFDAPVAADRVVRELRAVDPELIGAAALAPEHWGALAPAVLRRVEVALRVREYGLDTAYLEDGAAVAT
ncbi:NUDIX hydrolase [Yinghuangia sp. ASG 101]|nr:NUDIX hydrolase [Yinghuangia sp. ASG 101]